MKKLFLIVVLVLALAGAGWAAEGTKVLTIPEVLTVTVPEMAPDFVDWEGHFLGGKNYSNGRMIGLIEWGHPDGDLFVATLVLKESDGSFYLILFQVSYFLAEWDKHLDQPEKYLITEYYEDLGFIKTGKPSGILVRVKEPTKWEAVDSVLGITAIQKDKQL
jgi:hypothetical protein